MSSFFINCKKVFSEFSIYSDGCARASFEWSWAATQL